MKKIFIYLFLQFFSFCVYSQVIGSGGMYLSGFNDKNLEYDFCIKNNYLSVCPSGSTFGTDGWTRIASGDGDYFFILNEETGMYLQPENDPPKQNSKIILKGPNGSDIQKWKAVFAVSAYGNDNNKFYLIPKLADELYVTIIENQVSLQRYKNKYQTVELYCFGPNTITILKNGDLKYIADISLSDTIISYNPINFQFEYSRVKKLEVHNDTTFSLTKIVLINNNLLYASTNSEIELFEIEGTSNHPILTTTGLKYISEISKTDTLLYYDNFNKNLQKCTILSITEDYRTKISEMLYC